MGQNAYESDGITISGIVGKASTTWYLGRDLVMNPVILGLVVRPDDLRDIFQH